MGIDFGGFGKFTVDRVIEIAQEHNIKDIIVNLGDLRTLGSPQIRIIECWNRNPNQPGRARFTLSANNLDRNFW